MKSIGTWELLRIKETLSLDHPSHPRIEYGAGSGPFPGEGRRFLIIPRKGEEK